MKVVMIMLIIVNIYIYISPDINRPARVFSSTAPLNSQDLSRQEIREGAIRKCGFWSKWNPGDITILYLYIYIYDTIYIYKYLVYIYIYILLIYKYTYWYIYNAIIYIYLCQLDLFVLLFRVRVWTFRLNESQPQEIFLSGHLFKCPVLSRNRSTQRDFWEDAMRSQILP